MLCESIILYFQPFELIDQRMIQHMMIWGVFPISKLLIPIVSI